MPPVHERSVLERVLRVMRWVLILFVVVADGLRLATSSSIGSPWLTIIALVAFGFITLYLAGIDGRDDWLDEGTAADDQDARRARSVAVRVRQVGIVLTLVIGAVAVAALVLAEHSVWALVVAAATVGAVVGLQGVGRHQRSGR